MTLMAWHVVAESDLANNGTITYTATEQHRHEISILSNTSYEIFLTDIKKEIEWNTKITDDPELHHQAEEGTKNESVHAKNCIKMAHMHQENVSFTFVLFCTFFTCHK